MKKFTTLCFVVFTFFTYNNLLAQSCADGSYSFDDDVATILNEKCTPCHISSSTSGWNCSTYAGALAAGNNCGIGVTPGDLNASSLYNKIKFVLSNGNPDCGGIMPTNGNNLTAAEATIIQNWILEGAQESCPAEITGCTNAVACNYDVNATVDNDSCILIGDACDDGVAETENDVIDANCMCEGVVNIEEYENFYISDVFPQPTKSTINVNFYANDSGNATLKLYNANGKIVFTKNVSNTIIAGNQTLSIALKNKYNAGLYILSLTVNNRQIVQKIIME